MAMRLVSRRRCGPRVPGRDGDSAGAQAHPGATKVASVTRMGAANEVQDAHHHLLLLSLRVQTPRVGMVGWFRTRHPRNDQTRGSNDAAGPLGIKVEAQPERAERL